MAREFVPSRLSPTPARFLPEAANSYRPAPSESLPRHCFEELADGPRPATSDQEPIRLYSLLAARPSQSTAISPQAEARRLDPLLITGIAIAISAVVIGILSTGIALRYFLQPAGILIVLGGTLGITFITTPAHMLLNSAKRVIGIFSESAADRESLVEEIVACSRIARRDGPLSLQQLAPMRSISFLRDGLLLSLDIPNRLDLRAALETEVRLRERQGDADAKTLEVAGGFAPTIGILGTVVGLIEVLRQFSNVQAVGAGIGTAFVSTIYGLGLANLVLLPLAHRIRAGVDETFEIHELIAEGILLIAEDVHPALIRLRLGSFIRETGNHLEGRMPVAAAESKDGEYAQTKVS